MDVLWNSLLIFLILFILAYVQISLQQQEEKKIDTSGVLLIVVQWDDNLSDDVDTYVADPDGHLVFYQRKDDGLMHLERDDLGRSNDTITMPDGTKVTLEKNEERVVIRGIVPGEYVVNVHMYARNPPYSGTPAEVTVTLYSLKGNDTKIVEKVVQLTYMWEEKTAFRFRLSPDGQVTDINYLPKRLATAGLN